MNHTTMKATAVISEAWRSITSGAARLAPAVLALALTAAGMGVMDIAAGSTILDQASAYRQSGADILVLNAPDGIDAASCERLTSLTNVQAYSLFYCRFGAIYLQAFRCEAITKTIPICNFFLRC